MDGREGRGCVSRVSLVESRCSALARCALKWESFLFCAMKVKSKSRGRGRSRYTVSSESGIGWLSPGRGLRTRGPR